MGDFHAPSVARIACEDLAKIFTVEKSSGTSNFVKTSPETPALLSSPKKKCIHRSSTHRAQTPEPIGPFMFITYYFEARLFWNTYTGTLDWILGIQFWIWQPAINCDPQAGFTAPNISMEELRANKLKTHYHPNVSEILAEMFTYASDNLLSRFFNAFNTMPHTSHLQHSLLQNVFHK